MQDARREILKLVAAGDLTPDEAAARLSELDHAGDPADAAPAGPFEAADGIRLVRIAGSAEVVGDPTVKEAVADGPHVVRREGGRLVIESRPEPTRGYVFGPFELRTDLRQKVRVRMNPALPLEVDVEAGSVRVQGVRGAIRATVTAGSARVEGFEGPLEIQVQAGSVHASGKLTDGSSRITCEAGSVRVNLSDDSSVTIRARTNLGKVSLPGHVSPAVGIGVAEQETVLGSGRGRLEIDSVMGSVAVSA